MLLTAMEPVMNAFFRTTMGVVAAFGSVASNAETRGGGDATLLLTASVAPFCQIALGSGEVQLSNGQANFGPVSETCNTSYRVLASFQNLDQATIVTADGSAPLANDGTVAFVRPSARKIVQNWALRDAVKHDPAAPVFVQVNVSPL
jgi:hypothetical protein